MSGTSNNQFRIFLASFLTLIAAGMGFGARGEIIGLWSRDYSFTNTEIGQISGMGLAGFGVVILIASLVTDFLGYKLMLILALLCHLASGGIMMATSTMFQSQGKDGAYWCLFWGMFIFAVGNGLCEAVINPLVATLYPKQKTHYLNILHAGWPGGLVLGSLVGKYLQDSGWQLPLLLFLVPVLVYGIITLMEKFPESEAKRAGVSYGEMFSQFGSPILLFLLFIHACVGYVELGTDSWISNITGKIATGQGAYLFIFASTLMFVLRFFAGPIVERINPLGLLLVSAILGAVGLYFIGSASTVAMVWIAMTVYAFGKTFLWPTMLGVVGERFPKGGAVTMGAMGGIGMLSAGLLGGPGIGYKQDYYATDHLKNVAKAEATYDRYKADSENGFLFFPKITGLNGSKKEVILDEKGPATTLNDTIAKLEKEGKLKDSPDTVKLQTWWKDVAAANAETDKKPIEEADTHGGRMALKLTALVPLTMAVCYLLLVVYYSMTGGYKQEHLTEGSSH